MDNQNTTAVISVNEHGEIKETPLQTTSVTLSEEFNTRLDEKLAQLKTGKMQKGLSLSPQYFEFESKGTTIQGIFLGYKTISKVGDDGVMKDLVCTVWANQEKKVFINAGTAFVSAFQSLPIGTAFEATLTDLKPAKSGGKVKIYEVSPLF